MYAVWYRRRNERPDREPYLFMSGIEDRHMAHRITDNLNDDFKAEVHAWVTS